MKQLFDLQTTKMEPLMNSQNAFRPNKINGKQLLETKSGHWSEKEQIRYYAFLEKFEDKFNEKESRRQWKIFKAMSSFIQTRDPNQCRSHHHKMTKSFENIRQALKALQVKNHFLKKKSQKYGEELERIDNLAQEVGAFPGSVESQNSNRKQETLPICLNQTYFDPTNMPKILDIGNLRTDITNNCAEFSIQDYQKSQFSVCTYQFKGFPSTGLLTPTMAAIPSYTSNDVDFSSFIPQTNPIEYLSQIQNERQQKWLQCHEYFLKWVSKLNRLMGKGW